MPLPLLLNRFSFELTILLPQPLESWDDRHGLPCPGIGCFSV